MSSFLRPSRPLVPHVPNDRSPSTIHELASSMRLLEHLDAVARLETEAERRNREVLLQDLTHIFQRWICTVAVKKGLYPDIESAKEAGCSILVSGSYKLGICDPGSDIDTICVAPLFVSRDDFFETFAPLLQEHPGITSILPIRGTAVPIIELEFRGVSIDLQFVALPLNVVPKQLNILDDKVLQGLDPTDARVLNGPRANELIAMLVNNYETFKTVLRALRLWAKQRGLYSNKMGFLGGINLAILSAFICQLYPNACPAACLTAFFREFKDWAWPRPVFLTRPYTTSIGLNNEVWNPEQNPLHKRHLMPIITPAYPCMNSTFNVKRSTLAVMMMEIQRGFEVCQAVLAAPDPAAHDWAPLFAPTDFFLRFDLYLVLDIAAGGPEDLLAWKSFVESRIKFLVDALENERPPLPLSMVYPFPRSFDREEEEAPPPPDEQAPAALPQEGSGPAAIAVKAESSASAVVANGPGGAAVGAHSPTSAAGAHSSSAAARGAAASALSPTATARMLARSANVTYAEAEEDALVADRKAETSAGGGSYSSAALSSCHAGEGGNEVDDSAAAMCTGGHLESTGPLGRESDVAVAAPGSSSWGDNVLVAQLLDDSAARPLPAPGAVSPVKHEERTPATADSGGGSTAAAADVAAAAKRTQTVYSYYLGIMLDREKMRGTTLNLSRVLTDFKRMHLETFVAFRTGMVVKQRRLQWSELPPEVRPCTTLQRRTMPPPPMPPVFPPLQLFPDGRAAAETQRTAIKAAQLQRGIITPQSVLQAGRAANVWVRPAGQVPAPAPVLTVRAGPASAGLAHLPASSQCATGHLKPTAAAAAAASAPAAAAAGATFQPPASFAAAVSASARPAGFFLPGLGAAAGRRGAGPDAASAQNFLAGLHAAAASMAGGGSSSALLSSALAGLAGLSPTELAAAAAAAASFMQHNRAAQQASGLPVPPLPPLPDFAAFMPQATGTAGPCFAAAVHAPTAFVASTARLPGLGSWRPAAPPPPPPLPPTDAPGINSAEASASRASVAGSAAGDDFRSPVPNDQLAGETQKALFGSAAVESATPFPLQAASASAVSLSTSAAGAASSAECGITPQMASLNSAGAGLAALESAQQPVSSSGHKRPLPLALDAATVARAILAAGSASLGTGTGSTSEALEPAAKRARSPRTMHGPEVLPLVAAQQQQQQQRLAEAVMADSAPRTVSVAAAATVAPQSYAAAVSARAQKGAGAAGAITRVASTPAAPAALLSRKMKVVFKQ